MGGIELVALTGILVSFLAFYPGWMSNDSAAQYAQAIIGQYNDWHPVLMAWWWRQLDHIYSGPALLLLQSILLYWGAFYYFAKSHEYRSLLAAWMLVAVGFLPSLLLPVGQIWKDVVFATTMMFVFALLRHYNARASVPGWGARLMMAALIVLAVGSKINGAVALPFLFGYWLHVESPAMPIKKKTIYSLLLSAAAFLAPNLLVDKSKVSTAHGFQYTQLHDLLGISVRTGQILLPDYVVERTKLTPETAKVYYSPNSNNWLYFAVAGPLTTQNANELQDLDRRWHSALRKYPLVYLQHRVGVLAAVLRLGETAPAWVVVMDPSHLSNPPLYSFHDNEISRLLKRSVSNLRWLYLPWVYLLVIVASAVVAIWRRNEGGMFALMLCGTALAFVAPHLLVAPADDYRYLYFSYFCAVFAGMDLTAQVMRRSADQHCQLAGT